MKDKRLDAVISSLSVDDCDKGNHLNDELIRRRISPMRRAGILYSHGFKDGMRKVHEEIRLKKLRKEIIKKTADEEADRLVEAFKIGSLSPSERIFFDKLLESEGKNDVE